MPLPEARRAELARPQAHGGPLARCSASAERPTRAATPMTTDNLVARRTSPWTTREKLGRALWFLLEATLFRLSPRPCYRWRNWLLRRFGAAVAPSARVRPSVTVEVPWHLTVGPDAIVGDKVILFCLGAVTDGGRQNGRQSCDVWAGT